MTRRGILLGATGGLLAAGGAGSLVECDVLPGRALTYDVLGVNGEPGEVPDLRAGPVDRGTLAGAEWWVARPPGEGGARLPVVLALHPAGVHPTWLLEQLRPDRFLAASCQRFALAAIHGGPRSYWHPRDDGTDAGALVLERFLPMLADRGLDVRRPGFLGWSMGGFGALSLALRRRQAGQQVGPVVAASPAVWEEYDDGTPGSFDGPDDFAEHSLFPRRAELDRLDLRIDCGRGDPFYREVEELTDGLEHTEVHIEPGGHDAAYWSRVLPDQLAWLGARLNRPPAGSPRG